MSYQLGGIIALLALGSVLVARRAKGEGAFYRGLSADGAAPGLITLIFSQVTTWIFARSLMNAAILGFYYGIWGTLAYAAYYLSFFVGGRIIDHLRFEQGHDSIQSFLNDRFGGWGTACYNFVIGVRLVSEVFANLLVIGLLLGEAGSNAYILAVVGLALVTLGYSMFGGLNASLRTDLFQMLLFSTALVISAMSTLDSTLSSSAKLVAVDMGWVAPTLKNGRIAMALFMLAGVLLVFWGNQDLFSAVAVSGTASMYLAPVVFFSLWGDRRDIPLWSYLAAFALALSGAVLYFTESSGYSALLGDAHKYTKLLWISATVLLLGCLLFWIGGRLQTAARPIPVAVE